MRGSPHPATGPSPVRLIPARTQAGLLASGVAAVLGAALTGGLASPLVGLVAAWIFLLHTGPLRRLDVHLLVVALVVLAASGGSPGVPDALGALLPVAGLVLGRLRLSARTERESAAERRLAAIDAELARTDAERSLEAAAARRTDSIRQALVVAAAHAGAERAVLWDVDRQTRRISVRMASDGPQGTWWLPMAGSPLGWLADEGQPLRFEARPPVAARFANVVAFRLGQDPARAALLSLEFGPESKLPEPGPLEPVADEVRRAVDEQAERAAHDAFRTRVEILLETLGHLPDSVEPGRFSRDLVNDARRLTSAAGGAIILWEQDEGRVLAAESDDGGPSIGARIVPGESEIALAARAGTVIRLDLSARRVGPPHIVAPGERWPRRPSHLLAVPLPGQDAQQAILCVWAHAPFDTQGADLLERLAPFAGAQLARALEFGRVRDTAQRDPLTGLPNRLAFERAIDYERLRFDRYRHPVALIVIDVDHFKAVNDTHGHEAGDSVLRAIADCLRTGVREIDTLARFGGEEFVLLMPETALPAAAEVAERIRATVEAERVDWRGTRIPVRVSIGASACPDCVTDPEELLRSADAALYQAKHEGRNRVVTAPRTAQELAADPAVRRRR